VKDEVTHCPYTSYKYSWTQHGSYLSFSPSYSVIPASPNNWCIQCSSLCRETGNFREKKKQCIRKG